MLLPCDVCDVAGKLAFSVLSVSELEAAGSKIGFGSVAVSDSWHIDLVCL